MQRRDFITAIAGSLSFPLIARAQQPVGTSAETTANRNEPTMLTTVMKKMVERVEVETPFNFQGLVAAFESQLGHYDRVIGEELVRRHALWDEVTATMERMSGPHGLMIMAHLELGRTVSLTGILRECSLYLVGNPLITSEITDIRAGMLVPFHVELYADTGKAVISYDRPSSSLATLENRRLTR